MVPVHPVKAVLLINTNLTAVKPVIPNPAIPVSQPPAQDIHYLPARLMEIVPPACLDQRENTNLIPVLRDMKRMEINVSKLIPVQRMTDGITYLRMSTTKQHSKIVLIRNVTVMADIILLNMVILVFLTEKHIIRIAK